MSLIADRGFLAVTCSQDVDAASREGIRSRLLEAVPGARLLDRGSLLTMSWGLEQPDGDGVVQLSRGPRRHSQDLGPDDLATALDAHDPASLSEVLPTFAAALVRGSTLRTAADVLGFRHLVTAAGDGWVAVSTSSLPLARLAGSRLDRSGIAVASLLGWQLGQRTVFEGVTKLRPGVRLTLDEGEASCDRFQPPERAPVVSLADGVERAAPLLREWLGAYLDDHPDAVLQLTGGQDSRLLLSAIPSARRRGLRVMTLGTPGDPDVDIAAALAQRYGMRHEVLRIDVLDEIEPARAHDLCVAAARRVDFSADPLAHAALSLVESRAEPGPRISGLGGEVARGFYYLGPVTDARPSPRRVERLARWRMFVNEAVAQDALDPQFAQMADHVAHAALRSILLAREGTWADATDALYLEHRMQRWGGITETAVCLDRDVVNPMLDDRFVAVATGLAPVDKARSRFLGALQVALDADLARLPLEGRPAPATFTSSSVGSSARRGATTASKLRRKAVQRLRHRTRTPIGADLLARQVVTHWRTHPEILEPVRVAGVFDEGWLGRVVTGAVEPGPGTVALLLNLVATGHTSPHAAATPTGGGHMDTARGRAYIA